MARRDCRESLWLPAVLRPWINSNVPCATFALLLVILDHCATRPSSTPPTIRRSSCVSNSPNPNAGHRGRAGAAALSHSGSLEPRHDLHDLSAAGSPSRARSPLGELAVHTAIQDTGVTARLTYYYSHGRLLAWLGGGGGRDLAMRVSSRAGPGWLLAGH